MGAWPLAAGFIYLGHVTAEGWRFLLLLVVIVELPDGPRHDDGERDTCEQKRGKSALGSRQRPWCWFFCWNCGGSTSSAGEWGAGHGLRVMQSDLLAQ